ncbi:MAG: VanW family protein [Chloroflexota bacterium]
METEHQSSQSAKTAWKSHLLFAIPLGILLFAATACIFLIGFEVNQRGKIFPGVSMSGIDLSDLTRQEAAAQVTQKITYPSEGHLLIVDGDRSWLASPSQLGFLIDPVASAAHAYQIGRSKGLILDLLEQFRAWRHGIDISPVVLYDQRSAHTFLQNIAQEIDTPIIEANLDIQDADVVVNSGQIGRKLNIEASLMLLDAPLQSLQDSLITLVVDETPPVVLDASAAAELARQILSQPLVLSLPSEYSDAGPWTITPEELAGLLVIETQEASAEAEYKIGINQDLLRAYLSSLVPVLHIDPINARFTFNDDTRQLEVIEPAVIGRSLNVESSLEYINEQLMSGHHALTLAVEILDPPAKDNTTAVELGITELIRAETSYFYGSEPARVQNIATAAKSFHGLLIPPGETFSMADALGNISLENGYAEALIIYGDQTIKGVGGGVCQVSTTLFRTVFFSGYPIAERHAHAYRVGYYEMLRDGSKDDGLAGLDATVYVPLVDLRFTNDTPYWLLMETYLGQYYSLTWKFYSTSDGRSIEWQTTGPTDIVPAPEPLYRENPDLEEGEIKKVDYAADGAYVRVTRIVYRDNVIYFQDVFTTKYQPWQAIFEYGPGTKDIPTPKPTDNN